LGYLKKIARIFGGDAPAAAPDPDATVASAPSRDGAAAAVMMVAANAALAARDYQKAAADFSAVIALRHDDAAAHLGLGLACAKQQLDEDAADSFLLAAHFAPDLAEPHYQLALLAQKNSDPAAALIHVGRALALRDDFADAHNLAGACALAAGDPHGAIASFARAVELMPANARFHSNLGYVLLRDSGDFARGTAHLETAFRLDGTDVAIRCNYCAVLGHQGRTAEIIAICDDLLAAQPGLHEARLNRALALLRQGRFAEAWPDYEARKHTRSNYLPRPYSLPEWQGETLAGKTLLVYAEQGLGDEIMFASCLPQVMAQAERCIVECSPRLARLFARSFPQVVVHGAEQSAEDAAWLQTHGRIDFQVAAGSLPGFLRRRREDFPAHTGYLRADPQRVDYWRSRLRSVELPLTVGLAWRGGMTSTRRGLRSFALTQLAPVLNTPCIRFVSLQHDATNEEIDVASNAGASLEHWPEVMADIDETAALVASLDLVITVCSATVHLAGALGRRAWVMVPAFAEWRYLESGEAMPWYPQVKMFRQPRPGDWQPVITEIAAHLTALRGNRLPANAAAGLQAGIMEANATAGDAQRAAADFAVGQYAQARSYYERAVADAPDDAVALFRLGVIYGHSGLLNEAEQLLAHAAALQPDSIDLLNARANVAWLMSAWPLAIARFEAALGKAPGNAAVWANFALCLHDAGRLEAAADATRRALETDPMQPDALVNAALVSMDLGDTAGAHEMLRRALLAAPDFPEAHALNAQLLLQDGEFAAGWREYEWRLRCQDVRERAAADLPRWDGKTLEAGTLMVHAEQGLGDQIMFASCLPDVIARVADCAVECDARLVDLFARSFPGARFSAATPALPRAMPAPQAANTAHIHLGSLPGLLRNAPAEFPEHQGYLTADPRKRERWSAELAKLGSGLKIGIVWRGGVPRTRQTLRSIPLADWLPLLRTPGFHFVSLQHGPGAGELRALLTASDVSLTHWQLAIDDYDETAALVAALDGVVSVCGSIVHLAGALGKPVAVMVPACPEWRYLRAGARMPWYPSVRLYRQCVHGEWGGPLAQVANFLAALPPRQT
jgi:tetratricopeptide (TPR) repeat protein/ADP-heptose:LPS heptosyltransferase